ncbi:hypothetical protein LINPERHAP2_LOCUS29350 [Linum perenne]
MPFNIINFDLERAKRSSLDKEALISEVGCECGTRLAKGLATGTRRGAAGSKIGEAEAVPEMAPTPRAGEVKCNTDAAISVELEKTGVGMAIQSSSGEIVKFRMTAWSGIWCSLEAEGRAVLEALAWL